MQIPQTFGSRLLLAAILFEFCILGGQSHGDVFIGPSSLSNRLIVEDGGALLFVPFSDSGLSGYLVTKNKTNGVEFLECCRTYAIVGPTELVLQDSRVLSFVRLQTDAIHSLVVDEGQSVKLDVPTGRKLKFFSPMASYKASATVEISSGGQTQSLSGTELVNREIAGPASITFRTILSRNDDINATQFSYYFTDEFTFTANPLPLFIGSGNMEVTIDVSSDLKIWSPLFVLKGAQSTTNTYYRLRIRKLQ